MFVSPVPNSSAWAIDALPLDLSPCADFVTSRMVSLALATCLLPSLLSQNWKMISDAFLNLNSQKLKIVTGNFRNLLACSYIYKLY